MGNNICRPNKFETISYLETMQEIATAATRNCYCYSFLSTILPQKLVLRDRTIHGHRRMLLRSG